MVNNGRYPSRTAQLRDIKNLNNLRADLFIRIATDLKDPAFEAEDAYLSRKHGLTELFIELTLFIKESSDYIKHDEAMPEGITAHRNLKKLVIKAILRLEALKLGNDE